MKVAPLVIAVLVGTSAAAQTQPQSHKPGSTTTNSLMSAARVLHDPWAVSAASPNRNLSDAIGTTSREAPSRPRCSEPDCRPKVETAEQPNR